MTLPLPPCDPSNASVPAHDVLVVGGGINGAGIARDLAGRGLAVLLCEQHDLAQHTSSASTKLIHGGLRYLEHGEFGLVRKALDERERLWRAAPHLMRPLRFVMPHEPGMRPAWMIRLGLFLYDHLAPRRWLPGCQALDLRRHPAGEALQARFTRGFAYSDVWTDDARLVVLNVRDAADRRAQVRTRCRVGALRRAGDGRWQAVLHDADGRRETVRARAVVNAAGPWAARFLASEAGRPDPRPLRLVRGSHLVVPRLFAHEDAYLFQNPDRRILFAIPYEGAFTLLGTTDVEHRAGLDDVRIDAAETAYLCEHASRCLRRPVTPADVVWSYSGVRPLVDDAAADAAAVTRDYRLELLGGHGGDPPLLNVWGGKLTTYRRLAEEAADRLCDVLGHPVTRWTADAPLPGGDFRDWIGAPRRPDEDLARLVQAVRERHPTLGAGVARRWARQYGARVAALMAEGSAGPEVVPGVHEAELRYLHDHEWARSVDDVLWRRTKLGLHLDARQRDRVRAWWADAHGPE